MCIIQKPKITAFRWYGDRCLILDWETRRYAFSITAPDAGATIVVIDEKAGLSVDAAISACDICRFFLEPIPNKRQVEVILEVTYGDGKKSLGVTDQIQQAQRWVANANEFVRQARENRAKE